MEYDHRRSSQNIVHQGSTIAKHPLATAANWITKKTTPNEGINGQSEKKLFYIYLTDVAATLPMSGEDLQETSPIYDSARDIELIFSTNKMKDMLTGDYILPACHYRL